MKTTSSRHLSLVLALCAGLALLGASCKEDSVSIQATSTPKVATPTTTTPEQAWDMYVKGWKHQNLDEILAACAPNKEAQNWCRETFIGVKEAGNLEKAANAFEIGKLSLDGDNGKIRYYYFSFEDKHTTFTFEYIEGVGWRISE
jgi:hypothetical protein